MGKDNVMRVFDTCEYCRHAVVTPSLDELYELTMHDGQGNPFKVECPGLSKRDWPGCGRGQDVFSVEPCEQFVIGSPQIHMKTFVIVPSPRV